MSAVADMVYATMVAASLTGLAVDGMVKLAPKPVTSDFFEVASIHVERSGLGADLWVDRTIHRAVYMSATVRVLAEAEAGWRQSCIATGPVILYNPAVQMDQPVSLSWWSWGQCETLPPGRAMIETTWIPRDAGLAPVTHEVVVE